MNSELKAELEVVLGAERAARYEKEIDAAQQHHEAMKTLVNTQLPNARILLIDNSPRTQEEVLEWHENIPRAQVEALAATECTTTENESTGQRMAAMFGYQLDDPRIVRWHAPFTTPPTTLDDIDAILLTGSSAMVTDAPETLWMQRVMAVLQEAREKKIPTLGICFGHQIMAQAFGGEVDWMTNADGERIQEMGPVFMEYTAAGETDILFEGLSETTDEKNGFWVQSAHSQHISTQPPETTILATSAISPIQALKYNNLPMWSIQNHPEYTSVLLGIFMQHNPKTPQEAQQKNMIQDTFLARTHIFANFLTFVARYKK